MGWFVFGAAAWLAGLLLVPARCWKKLWPLGIAGMVLVFFVDSTLLELGAFDFSPGTPKISGIPIPYWIAYFPGGVLFGYYCPGVKWQRGLYVLMASLVLLAMELVMVRLGYFYHLDWSVAKAYVLNAGGFTVMAWLAELTGLAGRENVRIR